MQAVRNDQHGRGDKNIKKLIHTTEHLITILKQHSQSEEPSHCIHLALHRFHEYPTIKRNGT